MDGSLDLASTPLAGRGVTSLDDLLLDYPKGSNPFGMTQGPNPEFVEIDTALFEGTKLLNWFSDIARSFRNYIFSKKAGHGSKDPMILAEGDSWFNYPHKLNDIVDHLMSDYTVASLAAPGDTIRNMIDGPKKEKGSEYLEKALELQETYGRLKAIIFSGGGIDVLFDPVPQIGVSVFRASLRPYNTVADKTKAENFLDPHFLDAAMNDLSKRYVRFIQSVRNEDAIKALPIVINSYAYPFPALKERFDHRKPAYYRLDSFVGHVLDDYGIVDDQIRHAIMKYLINLFYETIEKAAKPFDDVYLVDNRKLLPDIDLWYDEIHPTSKGFKLVTENFDKVLKSVIK